MTNPTRLEAGHNNLLAYCTRCPSWRELTWDRPEALRAAATHVQLVHGNTEVARTLRERAASQSRRHAQR